MIDSSNLSQYFIVLRSRFGGKIREDEYVQFKAGCEY